MEGTIEMENIVESNPSDPPCVMSASEGEVQSGKESLENGASSETVVSNEAENDEKMETNEPQAETVQESVNTQENIENSNAQQTTASSDQPKPGEITPSEEQNTAVNEQELKYWNAVNENPQDFTSWTYLLQYVEQENKIDSARKAFESFLSRYPFCYGYWKKFADMEKKNGDLDRAQQVFEKGVEAIALSVDLWVHYLNFTSQTTKGLSNNATAMRSLFERAITAAGEDFRSDKLWDAYIEWEKAQKQLQKVTALYDRVLNVPTQNYSKHWKKFQDHINMNPLEEVLTGEELLKLKAEAGAAPPGFTVDSDPAVGAAPEEKKVESADTTEDTKGEDGKPEDPEANAIRKKVIAQRKVIYDANETEVSKRWTFEEGIKRPYFHVKPLEKVQLKNWRDYLDFEVGTGNHRRVVILFERCVIACALYEEFWQRFASYMEVHDCVDGCRGVFERGCYIHLQNKPNLHLSWAAFEEKHGNVQKAREILEKLDNVLPGLVHIKLCRANLERRSKEIPNASAIYEQAIAESTDMQLISFFSLKYAKFLTKIAQNFDKARDVLKTAVDKDKDNKRLYLQLLDLELSMQETNEEQVDKVFELVKDSSLPEDVKESFSQRHLEFLEDFSSNIVRITKAREMHGKLYKTKTSQGKKRANEEVVESGSKMAKADGTSNPNQFNNAYDGTADYTANAGYQTNSYNYNQAQWPGYNATQQQGYNYGNWYQQYGQTYAH
ncbi:pre-mRNA-processing factor 39-like isoform X2 [Dendronephthya gigantea]|uniref:pre-mRNA-processing factor 39-like isoform X2 n=1 Tax=Dendronephthya gigantea TaxID=151771 RepID=UPI00106C1497|nr:pre-mRNA-processing factor 39-like isoform X2 [Dendronephthya gigantea]